MALRPEAAPAPAPHEIVADDYVGDVAERTGFGGLEAVGEITMVAVLDLMSAYQRNGVDLETVKAMQLAMIAHCELMGDRMAIIDPPPGLSPQQVKEWRSDMAGYDSKYAALYYPWIEVSDPVIGTRKFIHQAGTLPVYGWRRQCPGEAAIHRPPRPSPKCLRSYVVSSPRGH